MEILGLSYRDGVLEVICSGRYGVGSEGNPSGRLVATSIEGWMADHPDQPVSRVTVDYRKVDYSWGDGPIWSVIPLFRRGVT